MPGDIYPKFRAAAVQAAPVFLDRDATIDKLDTLVQKAVDAVIGVSRTGRFGDGKIFISSIEEVIRIRTGETGLNAV